MFLLFVFHFTFLCICDGVFIVHHFGFKNAKCYIGLLNKLGRSPACNRATEQLSRLMGEHQFHLVWKVVCWYASLCSELWDFLLAQEVREFPLA